MVEQDDPELGSGPPEPPSVYPAPSATDQWIVEAPPGATTSEGRTKAFSGPNAQYCALTYAYEAFGNARFFYTAEDR